MAGVLVHLALSNLLLSSVLAGIAYLVHRSGRYPGIAHLLWVLVLAKLVTPPVLGLTLAELPVPETVTSPVNGAAAAVGAIAAPMLDALVLGLLATWAVGSGVVLVASLVRIGRFDRLLRRTSMPAEPRLSWLAGDVAHELGMRSAPALFLTRARISPMTWWTGGRVKIVLPAALPAELDDDQLRWVLAHELAHVRRHDHLVRWLEWLACVTFWWNPVAWFARANLRLDEEAACDALVIERLGARPKPYARALLAVVEHLSRPAVQPPAVATGIDGGGTLERRFHILVGGPRARRVPRILVAGLLGASLLVMPMGVGVATRGIELDADPSAPWLAADNQRSPAESAFLRAMADRSPMADGASAAQAETATVSANLKATKKHARKAKRARADKAKAGNKLTPKQKQARKAKQRAGSKKLTPRQVKARKARKAHRAKNAAAKAGALKAPAAVVLPAGPVLRF